MYSCCNQADICPGQIFCQIPRGMSSFLSPARCYSNHCSSIWSAAAPSQAPSIHISNSPCSPSQPINQSANQSSRSIEQLTSPLASVLIHFANQLVQSFFLFLLSFSAPSFHSNLSFLQVLLLSLNYLCITHYLCSTPIAN